MRVTLLFLLCWGNTWAEVPYRILEKHRRETIVTRVLLDNPDHQLCPESNTLGLGQKLALSELNMVEQLKDISTKDWDLVLLKSKVRRCIKRASCHTYHILFKTIQISSPSINVLKEMADQSLLKMTARDYEMALKKLKRPCYKLKQLQNL